MRLRTRLGHGLTMVASVIAIAPASALAHAEMSPKLSLTGELQLYSLAVPTEKTNATTIKVELTLPKEFMIDSFAPSPGWHRVMAQRGKGDSAVIQKVTWSGGSIPTGEDAVFQFLAEPNTSGLYVFHVRQTYSDGSIVDWTGPEHSDAPAPTIEADTSFGSSGTSALTIVALILGFLGLLAGGFALLAHSGGGAGTGRPLA